MKDKLQKIAVAQTIMEKMALPPPPEDFRMTKSDSGYKPEAPTGSPVCGGCEAFLIWGACRKIHGSVNRTGVCDLHDPI